MEGRMKGKGRDEGRGAGRRGGGGTIELVRFGSARRCHTPPKKQQNLDGEKESDVSRKEGEGRKEGR